MNKNQKSIQKKFGERIKELRTKANISQEELAFKANLDRTYLSGIERGIRNPSLKNIGKIAIALRVQPKKLFDF